MAERQWVNTGHRVEVPGNIDRIPEYDARSGEHLWTIFSVYRWAPGVETSILDGENLLSIMGPGCYYCEQAFTERLAKRRCEGSSTVRS